MNSDRPWNRCRLLLAATWVLGTTLLLPDVSRAADRFWVNPAGGPFFAAANWSTTSGGASGATVPGVADTARFDLPNTYDVEFLGNHSNQTISVDGGSNVTLSLGGHTYTLVGNPSQVGIIGRTTGETGRLTLRDGTVEFAQNTDQFILGFDLNSSGFLTVTQGAEFGNVIHPNLFVGDRGPGTLTVNSGGIVRTTGTTLGSNGTGNGSATISGLGSSLIADSGLTVGSIGVGSMIVNSGATVSGGTDQIASSGGSTGAATVSGAGSRWLNSGSLSVAGSGNGSLLVSSGGQVITTGNGAIGANTGGIGVATVSGSGSQWNHAALSVGALGRGTLTITGGGSALSSGGGIIGNATSTVGEATVTGAGSNWTLLASSFVGFSGNGTLDITSGGTVSGTNATLGQNATGVGNVAVSGSGSALNLSGTLLIASLGNGTMTVENGGQVSTSGININDPGGAPTGTLNFRGGTITTGTFTRIGAFNWTDGTLTVSNAFDNGLVAAPLIIDGADADDHPTLRLIGNAGVTEVTSVTVGNAHAAALEVIDGRALNLGSNALNIGALPGSNGTVVVRNGVVTAGPLAVGGQGASEGGAGSLTLEAGVVNATTLHVHDRGTVVLQAGALNVGTIANGGGTFDWRGGLINFTSGATLTDSDLGFLLGDGHRLSHGRRISTNPGANISLQSHLLVDGGALFAAGTLNNLNLLRVRDGIVSPATLNNANGAQIVVEGTGQIISSGGTFTNQGVLHMASSTAVVNYATMTNFGTIRGAGTIINALTNGPAGQIQTNGGDRLEFASAVSNFGTFSLVGGEMTFDATVTNATSSGAITARDAILRFGGLGLTNDGSLAVTFGTADVFGDITNSATGRIVVSGGSQATFYDDVANNGAMNVSASGGLVSTAVFFGSLSGNGIAGAGRVFNEGDLRPGFSPGTMAFGGDLSFGPLAQLEIELGGTTPGTQFDNVTVASSVFLDGTLDVSLINGFTPTLPGEQFTIVKAGTRTGEFSDVLGSPNAVLPGLQWTVTYTPTSAILSTTALPGDIDLDGDVDRRDTVLFTTNLGRAAGSIWTTGDFNNDGMTTLADLALQQANFGMTFPSPSASPTVAVPEPASWLLALAGLLTVAMGRRARHKR